MPHHTRESVYGSAPLTTGSPVTPSSGANILPRYAGQASPIIEDTIKVPDTSGNLVPLDLNGQGLTVVFKSLDPNGTVAVSQPAQTLPLTANPNSPNVRYVPSASDWTRLGDYTSWWTVTLSPGDEQDTPDFVVRVLVHGATVDTSGPCQAWVTGAEILTNCQAAQAESLTGQTLDLFATTVSQLLYEASGRRFAGICTRTVRPCRNGCACDWRGLGWDNGGAIGWGWGGGSWIGVRGNRCGCGSESSVKLPGYPVREIAEVTVDGQTVDPHYYRLDRKRYLTAVRYNDTYTPWPTCQNMSLPDAPGLGVFRVSYSWGGNPPQLGVLAALELGCQMSLGFLSQECALPPNTVQVQRQGVTIDRSLMSAYIMGQATGLPNVDAFLAAYNPSRLRRRPAVWSPDVQQYGRKTS